MTDKLHPLLIRQMKRVGITFAHENLPDKVLTLLNHISNAYNEFEAGHYTSVRSLEISSEEMLELRQRLQKEKEIIQAVMSDGFCIFDAKWNIIDLNKMGANLLCTAPTEAFGKYYTEVFSLYRGNNGDSELVSLSSLDDLLARGEVYQCPEGAIKSINDITTPISFSINPLPSINGESQGSVFIFRNIKDALEKELALKTAVKIAQKSNAAKTIFLANMSHEIRTPMNGVMGMLQLLMNTPLNEKQKGYVDKGYHSAVLLLKILGDILDFSKIESGKISFENMEFSITDEMNSIIKLFHSQATQKKLAFEVHFDEALPNLVKGDPHRLKQIISNLLSNAIKFTPAEGKIGIEFKLIEKHDQNMTIEGIVTDTGVGIPFDAQHNIFEMFSQADQSTTRKYGGTGLGLAITKQLVELMGGEIHVESTEGKGSKFWFTLRLGLQKEHDVKTAPMTATIPSELPTFDASLLVVEDNELNQAVTRDMLSYFGCEVDVVNSGAEALEILTRKKFDLILMDCHMPGLDGFTTTRKIRDLEKEKMHPLLFSPNTNIIVALTANALKGTLERCIEAGMNDYLTKPVQLIQLQETLEKYLPSKEKK